MIQLCPWSADDPVLPDAPDVALVTHGNVAVVAAQNHLRALGDDVAVAVDTGVHRGLRAAVADGLDLLNGVRHLHQAAAAGKQAGLEVRAQAEAHHRNVVVIDKCAELVDLAFRQELAFIHDNDVALALLGVLKQQVNVRAGGDDVRRGFQTDAAAQNLRRRPGCQCQGLMSQTFKSFSS